MLEGLQDSNGHMGRRGAIRLLAGTAAVAAGSVALAACGGVAVPGAVHTTGGATVDASTAKETDAQSMVSNQGGTIKLVARGTDIWSAADNFTYYFQEATGDGTWSCQVNAQGSDPTDKGNALAGILARDSGDPGAPEVAVLLTDGNGVTFRWRKNQGEAAESWPMAIAIGVTAPLWLQLSKKGDNWTVAYSSDGKTWENQTSMQVSFSNTTYLVGLAACSHSTKQQVDVFNNLSQGFKPSMYLDVNPANATSSSK